MKQLFTQKVKDDWIKALKSGKFTQAKGTLYQAISFENNRAGHCCIGVLGEIIPTLSCDLTLIVHSKNNNPYKFLMKTIGKQMVSDLWHQNDGSYNYDKPDYSNVIPMIQEFIVQKE